MRDPDHAARLLPISEVAVRLCVSETYVRRLIDAGELPYVDVGSGERRALRVRLSDLLSWIDARTGAPAVVGVAAGTPESDEVTR